MKGVNLDTKKVKIMTISKGGLELECKKAAFSSDRTCFVVGGVKTAAVCRTDSGVAIARLEVPGSSLNSNWFISPNGNYAACASGHTVFVWDITGPDPHLVKTFIGHTKEITFLSFSSSLISSSIDQSIKSWQTDGLRTESVATDKGSTSPPPMTIRLQAKEDAAIVVDLAGVVRVWDLSTGLCKTSFDVSDLFAQNSWGDLQLIDGRLIFVWYAFGLICIWTLKGESYQMKSEKTFFFPKRLRISGDGSKVFLSNNQYIQALSTWTGEVVGGVGFESKPSNDPLIVDGSRVWVHFENSQTQGWDFGVSGSPPILLPNAPPDPEKPRLDLIDGIKSESSGPSRIKDKVTGKEVFQLTGRYAKPTVVQCDGQYLVAGYKSGEVLILDFIHMIPQ